MGTQSIINIGETVWDAVAPHVPQPALDFTGKLALRFLFWYSDLKKNRYAAQRRLAAIPPAPLRYRVWGDPDIRTFLWSGQCCRKNILAALQKINRELNSFQHMLDFGCGCGRILMFINDDLNPSSRLLGTDIDREAIDWCSQSLSHNFQVNTHHPPLDLPSNCYDLILAIAVFRHFNEEDQFLWLNELKRVSKPGGIVLISLHGWFCWKSFSPEEVYTLNTKGFLIKPLKDPYLRSIYPDWYQGSYHNKAYVMDRYASYFDILHYLPQGIENETDLIILRKS